METRNHVITPGFHWCFRQSLELWPKRSKGSWLFIWLLIAAVCWPGNFSNLISPHINPDDGCKGTERLSRKKKNKTNSCFWEKGLLDSCGFSLIPSCFSFPREWWFWNLSFQKNRLQFPRPPNPKASGGLGWGSESFLAKEQISGSEAAGRGQPLEKCHWGHLCQWLLSPLGSLGGLSFHLWVAFGLWAFGWFPIVWRSISWTLLSKKRYG